MNYTLGRISSIFITTLLLTTNSSTVFAWNTTSSIEQPSAPQEDQAAAWVDPTAPITTPCYKPDTQRPSNVSEYTNTMACKLVESLQNWCIPGNGSSCDPSQLPERKNGKCDCSKHGDRSIWLLRPRRCVTCPNDAYVRNAETDRMCIKCGDGGKGVEKCNAHTGEIIQCKERYYRSDDKRTCIFCPAGKYCPGDNVAHNCTGLQYTDTNGANEPKYCLGYSVPQTATCGGCGSSCCGGARSGSSTGSITLYEDVNGNHTGCNTRETSNTCGCSCSGVSCSSCTDINGKSISCNSSDARQMETINGTTTTTQYSTCEQQNNCSSNNHGWTTDSSISDTQAYNEAISQQNVWAEINSSSGSDDGDDGDD